MLNKILFFIFTFIFLLGTSLAEDKNIFVDRKLAGYNIKTLDELSDLPGEEIDITTAILITSKKVESKISIEKYRELLDNMAKGYLEKIAPFENLTIFQKVQYLNDYIFGDLGFKFDENEVVENLLLSKVLDQKKGYCFGMVSLYLALGQRLEFDFKPVFKFGHVWLEYVDEKGMIHNIETQTNGLGFPKSYYEESEEEIDKEALEYNFFFSPVEKNVFFAYFLTEVASYLVEEDLFLAEEINNFSFKFARIVNSYSVLVQIAEKKENYSDVLKYSLQGLEIFPNFPDLVITAAKAYSELNEFDKALIILQKSLKVYKNNSELYSSLGVVYYLKGNNKLALKFYFKALNLAPKSYELYRNIYTIYIETEDLEGQMWVLQNLLSVYSLDPMIWFKIANVFYKQGSYEKALFYFKKGQEMYNFKRMIGVSNEGVLVEELMDLEQNIKRGLLKEKIIFLKFKISFGINKVEDKINELVENITNSLDNFFEE